MTVEQGEVKRELERSTRLHIGPTYSVLLKFRFVQSTESGTLRTSRVSFPETVFKET